MQPILSYGTVFLQFFFAGWIVRRGSWLARHPVRLTLEAAGIALGIWAVLVMRIGSFNITPDVKTGGKFVRRGPYRIIRHPMYAAVLLTTFARVALGRTLAYPAGQYILQTVLSCRGVGEFPGAPHVFQWDSTVSQCGISSGITSGEGGKGLDGSKG